MADIFRVSLSEYESWIAGEDLPTHEQLVNAIIQHMQKNDSNMTNATLIDQVLHLLDNISAMADVLYKSLSGTKSYSESQVSKMIQDQCVLVKKQIALLIS